MAAATDKATAPPPPTAAKVFPLLTRRQVEGLIADGRSIIIVDGHVLKVDGWLPYHPGGDKAIQHMVGREATDEVTGCVFCLLASPDDRGL